MIDTVRYQWQNVTFNEGTYDWLLEHYQTPSFTTRFYDVNLPWQGVQVEDSLLGTIGIKSNRTGNYLWCERSIPKLLYGDNCRMLSQEEAREGVRMLLAGVEEKFKPWMFPDGLAVCKRVDFYYQRHVPSSGEVFAQIARCLKSRKVALRLTGIEIPQSRFEHGRFYDKGIESGNEAYVDVVRHEEQLRGPKAGYYVSSLGDIRIEEAREHLNRRFEGWPSTVVESYNLGAVLEEHKAQGLAAGLLALHPEYDGLAKQKLSSATYYRLRNLALSVQQRMSRLDLRVPVDAWREGMVL